MTEVSVSGYLMFTIQESRKTELITNRSPAFYVTVRSSSQYPMHPR